LDSLDDEYNNVHIVRARGKYPLASLCKIMNQFGVNYSVLHDSDTRLNKNGENNGAWTANERILAAVQNRPNGAKVRLVASIHNFEEAYFGTNVSSDKPYNAVEMIKGDEAAKEKIRKLLIALVNHQEPLPDGAVEWSDQAQLEEAVPEHT